MARKVDKINVIDIEATCWEGAPPVGQENEIIEIGLCVLDVAMAQRLEKRSILVRPEHSRVSDFCTKLTTLTQAQVDSGVSFKEACAILKKEYEAKDRIWASFGDYDRRQFEKQCQAYKIGYPFGPRHLNVKSLFAMLHALPEEIGMAETLQALKLPLEGTHHRGDDDAWNIAAILSNILLQSRPKK
jgi:inhibitor of KinA sporulation pathway (predicted exonuclease)